VSRDLQLGLVRVISLPIKSFFRFQWNLVRR